MSLDVLKLVEPYLSTDQSRWAKLSSNILWRRLQLVLLRAILVELRTLNASQPAAREQPAGE